MEQLTKFLGARETERTLQTLRLFIIYVSKDLIFFDLLCLHNAQSLTHKIIHDHSTFDFSKGTKEGCL